MSAKATGRRTPLSLSGAAVGKNQKTPIAATAAENRRDIANKTETMKDKKLSTAVVVVTPSSSSSSAAVALKKSESSSISKNSSLKDEKKSQNGVVSKSNGNVKDKNTTSSNAAATATTNVEKSRDKDKEQQEAVVSAQKSSTTKEKSSTPVKAEVKAVVAKVAVTPKAEAKVTVTPKAEAKLAVTPKVETKLAVTPKAEVKAAAAPQVQEVELKIEKTTKTSSSCQAVPTVLENNQKSSSNNQKDVSAIEQKKESIEKNSFVQEETNKSNVSVALNVEKKLSNSVTVATEKETNAAAVDGGDVATKVQPADENKVENIVEIKNISAPLTSAHVHVKESQSSTKSIKLPATDNHHIDDIDMMEPHTFVSDELIMSSSTPGKIVKRKDGPPKPSESKLPEISSFASGGGGGGRTWNTLLEQKPQSYSKFTVSGRPSIHTSSGNDYMSMQGVYRKTKTDLDVSCNTNTSLNVTVGSEVPNNTSFSFFGQGRKRERTPPNNHPETEVMEDQDMSAKSPKRPRIDMASFFMAVASPLTMLRSRFSRTSIQNSTPVKLQTKLVADQEKDEDCANVSDISIEEDIQLVSDNDDLTVGEIAVEDEEQQESTTTAVTSINDIDGEDNDESIISVDDDHQHVEDDLHTDKTAPATSDTQLLVENTDDIKITVTPNATSADKKKHNNCSIM